MTELAALVIELAGGASTIATVPLPEGRRGDPARRRPDITRARELLGWAPLVSLREGLVRTLDSLRAEVASPPG